MVSDPNNAIEIFFSYSHKDQELRDQLETQLSLLKRQGFISSWHDRKIGAGEEWAQEIDRHLNSAQIILLLVSADFIASHYCYEQEMMRALERHRLGEARVIPIILRPCDWHNSPFGQLQALPTDGQPITGRNWHTRDEAFLDVTQGIRRVIEKFRTPSSIIGNNTSMSLSKTDSIGAKLSLPKPKRNKSFNPYEVRNEWIEYITANIQEAIEREEAVQFFAEDVEGHKQIRILNGQNTIYALNIYKGSMGKGRNDDGISFSQSTGRMISSDGINAWGRFTWDTTREEVVLELNSFGMLSIYSSTGATSYTKEDFLQVLWNEIRSVIERNAR